MRHPTYLKPSWFVCLPFLLFPIQILMIDYLRSIRIQDKRLGISKNLSIV